MLRYVQQYGVPALWVLGGAVGVDTQAEDACLARGWTHVVLYPLYRRYGRWEAPRKRNLDMVRMVATSKWGTFLAFPQKGSRGTLHCMSAARKAGLTLFAAMPT